MNITRVAVVACKIGDQTELCFLESYNTVTFSPSEKQIWNNLTSLIPIEDVGFIYI